MESATLQSACRLVIATLVALLASPGSVGAQRDRVAWVWSGGVTSRSAVVKAKVESGARGRLLVAEPALFENPRAVPRTGYLAPDDNGILDFEVGQLAPDTAYQYVVQLEDGVRLSGRFHTFAEGPMSFHFVLGSCISTGSEHEIFDVMRRTEPLFFLQMGDFHYEDIVDNDPAEFREAFDANLASARQARFYREVPIAYVWDDHDYGPDNADRTSPAKPAALQVYQQYVPHYPLTRGADGKVGSIQQAFTVGRVRFLMTDVRSGRDPVEQEDGPGKSVLGEAQREWLFRELEAARDRFALVVWVNVVPWITKAVPGTEEGWEPYSWERRLIADRIAELGLVDRMLVLSGDAHMVAIDDGTNSNYASDRQEDERGFPVLHAAPLDRYARVKGGPYTHGVAAARSWFGLGRIQQFGRVRVFDDGDVLRVELSGHDEDGEVLEGMFLRLRCDDDGCRPVDAFLEDVGAEAASATGAAR